MDWIEPIRAYNPCNEQERKDKDIMLHCIDTFDDILQRENEIVHFTSSAFVVNGSRDKVLMVHHNIFNSWSLTGGHTDGDENLFAVAMKEVKEETGVEKVKPIVEGVFSLDVLAVMGHVKKDRYVAPHLHLSVLYLFEADDQEALTIKEDENSGVRWIPIKEVEMFSTEPHMIKIYRKLILKTEALIAIKEN